MKWSKKIPTEDGLYWFKSKLYPIRGFDEYGTDYDFILKYKKIYDPYLGEIHGNCGSFYITRENYKDYCKSISKIEKPKNWTKLSSSDILKENILSLNRSGRVWIGQLLNNEMVYGLGLGDHIEGSWTIIWENHPTLGYNSSARLDLQSYYVSSCV